MLVDAAGRLIPGGRRLYMPWGEKRYEPDGPLVTRYRYTGQYNDGYINIYWYNSRWYDPGLGRWLQPDAIVPDLLNPIAYDRYQYVYGNPVRFIDPSGHFTEDAIKEYLESIYGDDWKKYWDEWSADKEWVNLLRKAQAGDILTRLIDGKANSYQFFGEGEKVLGGIASIAEISPNPEHTGLGDLNSVFRNQGNGLGVMGFINEGNGIIVRATKGAISYSIHSVTTQDVDGKNAIISGAISVVVAPWNPWIGIATGFASGYLSRQIGQIPGLVVGDLELTIGSYNSYTSTRWGYEYTSEWSVYKHKWLFIPDTELSNSSSWALATFSKPINPITMENLMDKQSWRGIIIVVEAIILVPMATYVSIRFKEYLLNAFSIQEPEYLLDLVIVVLMLLLLYLVHRFLNRILYKRFNTKP